MTRNDWKGFHSALYLHKCDYCIDLKLYRIKSKHFKATFTLQHTSFTTKFSFRKLGKKNMVKKWEVAKAKRRNKIGREQRLSDQIFNIICAHILGFI